MKTKIKIDLCKLFGVKECQEFYIDSHGLKYKIENDKLMAEFHNGWDESENSIAWLFAEHEIEILKPETPHEIKKILKGLYNLGFRCFYKEDLHGVCAFDDNSDNFDENDDCLRLEMRHPIFGSWTKTLTKVPNNTYYIEDFI